MPVRAFAGATPAEPQFRRSRGFLGATRRRVGFSQGRRPAAARTARRRRPAATVERSRRPCRAPAARASSLAVSRDPAERRPVGSRRDVLRPAAGASHVRADIGNRERRAQFGRQPCRRHDRIMPASVAPTKYVYSALDELAEHGRLATRFVVRHQSAFNAAHVPTVPSQSFTRALEVGRIGT